MTLEEKRRRNASIVTHYQAGRKLSECGVEFKLGRQRILQILKQAGVWKPHVKSKRTKFLGVSVTEPTKEALGREADRRGVSVSKLASDVLDAVLDIDDESSR